MPVDINSPDIQFALRSSNPIVIDGVPIHHVSFSKITSKELGYTRYSQLLSVFCTNEEAIKQMLGKDVNIPPVLFICLMYNQDKQFKQIVDDSCMLFFNRLPSVDANAVRIKFLSESDLLFEINSDNFDDVSSVIKLRNGILSKEETEMSNPASEKARQIIQRRNEIRKKKAKAFKDKNNLNTWDVIDVYTAVTKTPYEYVMAYDPFQLSASIVRVKAFDDYEVGVQSLLHGAKSSDVNLSHWLAPLKKNEEQKDDE